MSSPFPKCPVCQSPHGAGTPHKWAEEKPQWKPENVTAEGIAASFEAAKDLPVPSADEIFGPTGNSKAKKAFERAQYQKIYMRHKPKAKSLGMSVKQYWAANKIDWRAET